MSSSLPSDDEGPQPPAGVDDTELRSLINGAYTDAADYVDEILAPERERAFDYFLGDIYTRDGEPEKAEDIQGRTSIVVREVADIIHAMLPGLVRIFAGGDEVVRYEPVGPEDEAIAEQQTDYVNYLLNTDGNNWFITLHDALHDGLLKKNGTIGWEWDSTDTVEEFTYQGLTLVQAQSLRDDPDIVILEENAEPALPPGPAPAAAFQADASPASATGAAAPMSPGPPSGPAVPMPPGGPPNGNPAAGPPGGMTGAPPGAMPGAAGGAAPSLAAPPMPRPLPPMPPEQSIDMRVRRTTTKTSLKVFAVPPEEFLIDRAARNIPTSGYCAHRTTPTVSELVSRGYDREEIEGHASADLVLLTTANSDGSTEAQQRNPGLMTNTTQSSGDKSLWRVLHVVHYIRYDSDDDGIAELHRIRTVGPAADYIHDDEVVPEAPFATGSPVRMPHAVIGLSVADQVSDLQDLKTNVLRATLDSLAQSIFPDMAVVENAVVMEDFLGTDVGRVLRMKAPGMAMPMSQPFIGAQSLAVMQYLDEMRTQRTGITRASTGLDDKVLQSTTRTAVENTVEKAQERVEMIARTLAETLLKDAFGGILRCVVRNQDRPRTVRLRNRWVDVDPRFWNTDADVTVNTGLGRGSDQMRLQSLGIIAAKQQEIITATGPGNPLVAPSQFRETLAEMTKLSGFKDASRFWKPITKQDDQMIIQQAAQTQQQNLTRDPAQVLAQVEKMKAETEAATKKEEQRLRFIEAQAKDDRERDAALMDFMLKAAEISAKYGAQLDIASMKNMLDRERSAFQDANDVAMKREQAMMQQATQQQRMQQDGGLAQQQMGQDGQLAREKIQSAENIAQFKARQAPAGPAQ